MGVDGKEQFEELLRSVPGGMAKIALDDMLTMIYGTEKFYALVKNVADKSGVKEPISLLRMVYSADVIYLTQQIATQKQRKDKMLYLNFRTLQHNGSFRWITITGMKSDESYQIGNKAVPVYSCIAVDATDHMLEYKKLEQKKDYHRVISELARDIFFEYEIASDILTFSNVFREMFGKDNVMSGFRKRLEKTKLIHSDELPAVISIYNSMMSGRKQARFELRLIPKDGNPCWYTCYASIIPDENRNPYKVVGKLSVMNTTSKDEEKIQYIPQLDSISGVCTRDSSERMIKDAIAVQKPEELSALMLVDVRNYKGFNELRRSVNGENVFADVGKVLKSHFRTSDIIGRMGLSEFVIYMKGVPSERTVCEKAERVCALIENIHSYQYTKSGLTTSIGIAIHLGTADYTTLIANANTALVMAKKVSASSFEVFSTMMG